MPYFYLSLHGVQGLRPAELVKVWTPSPLVFPYLLRAHELISSRIKNIFSSARFNSWDELHMRSAILGPESSGEFPARPGIADTSQCGLPCCFQMVEGCFGNPRWPPKTTPRWPPKTRNRHGYACFSKTRRSIYYGILRQREKFTASADSSSSNTLQPP